MISDELLRAVLAKPVLKARQSECNDNEIIYYAPTPNTINIHELAHKCKEWAFSFSGDMILSSVSEANMGIASIRYDNGDILLCEVCDTEPEATFKACQWILDNEQ